MTTTTDITTSLTERYVQAVLRRLPPGQRPDIERELRTSIADAADGRVEAGSDPAAAERDVLTELGDPVRLAAGYTDRPLHLIGPALFLDYVLVVKALLATVLPIVATVIAVVRAIEGGTVIDVVGGVVGTAITTAVHIVFWTTAVFAVIERTPDLRWTPIRPWTPDALPEQTTGRASAGELVAETVFSGLFLTLVLLSPTLRFQTRPDGTPIGVLSPWLWDTGVVYAFVALVAAGLALSFVRRHVRWNRVVAVVAALTGLGTASLLVWVGAHDRLLNPEFVAAAGWPQDVVRWVHVGLVVTSALAIVVTLVQAVAGFLTRSWQPTDLGAAIRNAVQRLPGPSKR
jgi:hypothetical protein